MSSLSPLGPFGNPAQPRLGLDFPARLRNTGCRSIEGTPQPTLMSTVTRLADRRPGHRTVFFTRTELNLLLSLYSRRVSAGEWRDYAIDHRGGVAAFSVFRHSRDQALYRVLKLEDAERGCTYQVIAGPRRLGTARTLRDVLRLFEPKLRLVT
jgi:hypothetical protein